jgi:mono/diheme cytochrome c family protein
LTAKLALQNDRLNMTFRTTLIVSDPMIRCLTTFALVSGLVSHGYAAAAEAADFETRVLPILTAHCVKCHGPDKANGKLRHDSAAELTATAKETLLADGKPDESELLNRITLPDGNRKRMPKGAAALSTEDIAMIRQWIEGGAPLTSAEKPRDSPNEAAPGEAIADATAETPPRTPGEEDPELAKLPPASAEAIAAIMAAGGSVMPLFGDSPLLQVSFAQATSPPGDEALAALAGAADNVVWLNLSKAQITAAGVENLVKLKNLIQLHLEHSTVDDAGVAKLAGLPRLEYVNLYGTSVSDAGVTPLVGLAKLRNLYVWQTKVSWDAAQGLQKAVPGLEVNLGWDHPQVMKLRVTKELETAKKISATASAQTAELEQQFTAAKQAKEQAEARVKELEGQLEGLDKPAEESVAPSEEEGQGENAEAESTDEST